MGAARLLAFGLLLLGGCSSNLSSSNEVDVPFCKTSGDGENRINILIFGESWATKGRMIPEIPDTFNRETGISATACQFGYSGHNTELQFSKISKEYPGDSIRNLFAGNKIKYTIILTGVNDVVQHLGSDNYKYNLNKLVDLLRKNSDTVLVMEVPHVNLNTETSFKSSLKRKFNNYLNDKGLKDPVKSYNDEFKDQRYHAEVIPYHPFFNGYPQDKAMMKPDGIHLTDENFHRLGEYIGDNLAHRYLRK